MERPLFTAALAILMLLLGLATWSSGRLLRQFIPPHNVLLTVPENLLRLFLIGLCIALGLRLGPGAAALGWQVAGVGREILIGVLAAAILAPLLNLAGAAVIRRWGPEMVDNRVLRAIVPSTRAEWIGVTLALLPAAALEELLFRSLPLGGLTWLTSPWVLMWPLSLVFGALHISQGPWGVVGTAVMGLVLSGLYLWTGGIWAPLMAHWLLNVVEVTIAQRQGLRPLWADRQLRP